MTATTSSIGSAERWGPLWSSRPQDWASTEEQQLPTYEEAIRQLGIAAGQRVLEVGCGSGVFLRAAADRGAEVYGVDASEALIDLARSRVPEADLRVGDMQFLPFEDDRFDAVAGFNSFFFAQDMVAALREAGRVAKPGAPVAIQVWGRPERCDLDVVKHVMRKYLPPPPQGAPVPKTFSQPGVLEALAAEAGLTPRSTFDVSWSYEYADDDALIRGMVSAGGLAVAAGPEREGELGQAFVEGLAPYRTPSGGYSLTNEWHTLIADA
jgi:SAM-dependent methyltransferase